jgi:hypothetical protein
VSKILILFYTVVGGLSPNKQLTTEDLTFFPAEDERDLSPRKPLSTESPEPIVSILVILILILILTLTLTLTISFFSHF